MRPIKDAYKHIADKLIANSRQPSEINTETVFQEANKVNRDILNAGIIRELLCPESYIANYSQFEQLNDLSQKGHSCLIVMEHYSNFDLPSLLYLLENTYDYSTIADNIVAIAGMKLNTESDFVRAFTEAYTRIVICPSRSLRHLIGKGMFEQELIRCQEINKAALHKMTRLKHSGKIILIFPTGTRYRAGVPETRRALAEVDSYLRGFDYFLPVAISGNILRINEYGDMSEDFTHKDCMVFHAGAIIEAKKWREDARSLVPEDQSAKQFVADCIMEVLNDLHSKATKQQYIALKKCGMGQ